MRYSFTIEGENDADLVAIKQLVSIVQSGSPGPTLELQRALNPVQQGFNPVPQQPDREERPDPMVQPDRTPVEEPKPRGRPRKSVADVGMSHPHGPVGSGKDQPAPANGPDAQLSDQGMLTTVGAFCSAHPDKTSAISSLLRTFSAERITQLEPGQRQPFLTKLEALAASGPEAA